MTAKMIQDLRETMEAQTEEIPEMCHKDLENYKKKKKELSNTVSEMKTTLEE